jgi:hypothetical protein
MASEGLGTEDWATVSAGQSKPRSAIVFDHLVKHAVWQTGAVAERRPCGESSALWNNAFKA